MNKPDKKTVIFLFAILVLAIFFRFYKLADIPPGLYPDVAINGNDASTAFQAGEYKWFYPENNGREGLFINLIAFSFAIFGISIWSIKVVPAIIGFLTVLGLYLMTKKLFGLSTPKSEARQPKVGPPQAENPKQYQNSNDQNTKLLKNSDFGNSNLFENCKFKMFSFAEDFFAEGEQIENSYCHAEIIALLSSFFLAISFWHILFSRLGFRAIMVPFFLIWSFYFLFKAMRMIRILHANDTDQKPRRLLAIGYWLLAGVLFGLGFHTYIAFRVAPAILAIIFFIDAYNHFKLPKPNRAFWKLIFPWLIFGIGVIIAVLPLALYFYDNPQDFIGRAGQVSVFAAESPLKTLSVSTIKTLGMFNIWGDCNWRHNYACKPELPIAIGLLFLIGLFVSLKKIFIFAPNKTADNNRDWSLTQISLFLLVWFFAMLLPAILTNEGLPHALRVIGAIPPVYILAAIGGIWTYNKIKTSSPFANKSKNILSLIFLITLPISAYGYYFIQWGQNHEVRGAHTQYFVDIGNYLNSLPDETKKYVIVNEGGVPVPHPDGIPMPAQTVIFATHDTPNILYIKPEEVSRLLNSVQTQTVFILMKYNEEILNQLKEQFSKGQIKEENNIWTFQINPNDKIQMTNQ